MYLSYCSTVGGMRVFLSVVVFKCNSHVTATPHCAHHVILLDWQYHTSFTDCRRLLLSLREFPPNLSGSYACAHDVHVHYQDNQFKSTAVSSTKWSNVFRNYDIFLVHLSAVFAIQTEKPNREPPLFSITPTRLISSPFLSTSSLFDSFISSWLRVAFPSFPCPPRH